MKRYIWYPIFLLVILLNGCIQENNALVYPPLIVETVKIRYFNLHNDEINRTLQLDEKVIAKNISFNSVSYSEYPPYDSSTVQILKGNNVTYLSKQKFKFARQSNYVMIALPDYRILPDSVDKYEDTIVYIQTTILTPPDTNQCFVKFLNANPDTSINYSIKIGCPNGEDLFVDNSITNVSYLQSTGVQAVYEGKRVISIIKNKKVIDSGSIDKEVIGIFELDLQKLGQYALIVNKKDEVYFINELEADFPIQKLNNIQARNAYIRVVNLSSANVSVNSSSQGNITTNLNASFIDNYIDITTCDALSLDVITLEANTNITDTIFMSFDIYKKYSIFVFDTKNIVAGTIIGIPPIDDRIKLQSDKAIVRVVNGNINDNGITVSIGARSSDNNLGYESGTTLAVNLLDGEYSKEMYINGGILPISVFASTQPTKYMFSSNIEIKNGKEYIIAINGLDGGNITAIELNDESSPIQYGNMGSFLQFVNVCNGDNILNFTISNLIDDGNLSSANMLTTFVPVGNNSLQTASKTFNFNATIDERTLLIATSKPDNPVIFALQNKNMGASDNSFCFRFINASEDIPILQVDTFIRIEKDENGKTIKDENGKDKEVLGMFNDNILFQSASLINKNVRDRKYSFRFVKQGTDTILYKANDLFMTLNKNYSIIFYGNKEVGYGIYIVQEY